MRVPYLLYLLFVCLLPTLSGCTALVAIAGLSCIASGSNDCGNVSEAMQTAVAIDTATLSLLAASSNRHVEPGCDVADSAACRYESAQSLFREVYSCAESISIDHAARKAPVACTEYRCGVDVYSLNGCEQSARVFCDQGGCVLAPQNP